ncbi:hemicentin-1-like isoform X2 [Ostrea edulis]|uniref:hemicentin-1-like isoform X2 n=1 Tax=Ostrea edulis TaxID=37623 RepID=UPI0024AECCE1|nr:hemicentin-1-like isoform X2 [Ostrea edulis]
MLLTILLIWTIFGGFCVCLDQGKNVQNTQICNLQELEHYRNIHCFDRNHVPINTVVNEGTKCLVSCNHERAFSTWKACVNGEWVGSDISCKNIQKKDFQHSKQKRLWWGGGGGDKTPPDITCPPSKTIYADYTGRVYVWYNQPTATDGGSSNGVTITRTSGIASGTRTGIGTYRICYKAKDKSDNESKECCFYVYVRNCPTIDRCRRVHCTNTHNQKCQLCDAGYHPEGNRCEHTVPQLTADGSTSVDEGQSITLRCTLSTLGNSHITWSWVCGDDTLTTGVTNTGIQSVLTLTANRKYNHRRCQCRATSPRLPLYNRTSGTQTITVYYAPPVAPQLTTDGSTSVDEGQSITLRCTLSTLGNPHITWNWVCGYDTLTTGVTNTGNQSVLTLTTNRKYNQGRCQCRATSPRSSLLYNRTSGPQTITVYYTNVITSILSEEYVINEHGRLQIKCNVDGNPLSTITWLLVQNNTVVKRDSNVSNSSLDILSANCVDHGNYKVTAENGKGPAATRTTHVAVRCKPRMFSIDFQTPEKLGIGSNESLQILVKMLLYPQATLTRWVFVRENNESKVIQNNTGGYRITDNKRENKQNISLYKRKVDTEDFGQYTIMVRNDVGYFTRIFYVHVDAERMQEKTNHQRETIVGSVVGSVAFIIAVLVIVIFIRRRYKGSCVTKMETERIDVKAADLSKDGSKISLAGQNVQGERQTYESIQWSSTDNGYEELSTVCKKQDERDQIYCNSKMSASAGVYVNLTFQN